MSGQSANPATLPVLITRPEPQASRFAADLALAEPRARPVIAPLMRTEFLAPDLPPGPFAALILTSEAGAEAAARLGGLSRGWPETAFCVGDRTARVAREAGFQALSAGGTASDLTELVRRQAGPGPLLWLRGREIARDIAQDLRQQGREVVSLVVYAQDAAPPTDEMSRLLLGPGPLVVPVFSPRSARLLAAALPGHVQAELCPVTISRAALAALPPVLQAGAIVADTPDGAGMIGGIRRVIASRLP